jgi:hypothetical protein
MLSKTKNIKIVERDNIDITNTQIHDFPGLEQALQ